MSKLGRYTVLMLASVLASTSVAPALNGSEPERGYPVFPVVFFPPSTPIYGAAISDRAANAARIIGGRRLLAPTAWPISSAIRFTRR
jgi:hypothetical protein